MTILARIQANGGKVRMDRWHLRLTRGRLSDAALAWIAERKDALRREVWPQADEWEERAAIREFDGGQDRAEAEAAAYQEVMGDA